MIIVLVGKDGNVGGPKLSVCVYGKRKFLIKLLTMSI